MRIVAPFDSSTSPPQLSQTSTVFLATLFLLDCERVLRILNETRQQTMRPPARGESATTEAGSAAPAPPDRAIYRVRGRRANGAAENPRSFARRDTARRRPD